MGSRAAYLLRSQGPGDSGRLQAQTQGSDTLSCLTPSSTPGCWSVARLHVLEPASFPVTCGPQGASHGLLCDLMTLRGGC